MEPILLERVKNKKIWGSESLTFDSSLYTKRNGNLPSMLRLDEHIRFSPESIVGIKDTKFKMPFIVKYIEADENLSIQVHPDKDETWIITNEEPAEVGVGLKKDMMSHLSYDLSEFRDKPENFKDLVVKHKVKRGDIIHVPSEVVHYIGAGVQLIEVQSNHDTTLRLYDWDRREIDTEKGIQSIAIDKNFLDPRMNGRCLDIGTGFISTDYYNIDILMVNGGSSYTCCDWHRQPYELYYVLSGDCIIAYGNKCNKIKQGDNIFIPVSLKNYSLHADEPVILLKVWGGEKHVI